MIELGDEVKDSVTGYKGIAIGKTQWLFGCSRIIIQPPVGKDGKVMDSLSFDEPSVVLVKKAKKKTVKVEKTGGPGMTNRKAY